MDTIIGMTVSQWRTLLQDNDYGVDRRYYARAAGATIQSLFSSTAACRTRRWYQDEIAETAVESPFFVIGHWRSGTTLLHEVLAQDSRFAYPTIADVSNPSSFVSMKPNGRENVEKSRPMDSVTINPNSPAEDEFACCKLSLRSPLFSWNFPRNEAYYDRFLTFRDAEPQDYDRWKAAFTWFLKGLTFKYGKQLLLKSPPHTARIRLILEIFPEAHFIHIYRNPYDVYRSTRNLFDKLIIDEYLQSPNRGQIDESILRRYVDMYDAFFDDVHLIPEGHYHEVRFEDFEKDIVWHVADMYQSLQMTGFEEVKPKIEAFVASKTDYQKNVAKPIPDDTRHRVAERWWRNFEIWGYPT